MLTSSEICDIRAALIGYQARMQLMLTKRGLPPNRASAIAQRHVEAIVADCDSLFAIGDDVFGLAPSTPTSKTE